MSGRYRKASREGGRASTGRGLTYLKPTAAGKALQYQPMFPDKDILKCFRTAFSISSLLIEKWHSCL
jgi:hypothetical protein